MRGASVVEPCGRCDGSHSQEHCPHFKQARGSHADQQPMPKSMQPRPGPTHAPLRVRGRLVGMPGDNSCLFHSVKHGLKKLGRTVLPTERFRASLTVWMMARPTLRIGTAELGEWVRWETGGRVPFSDYCRQMGQPRGQWGGAPEIASMATKEKVNIWVWEPSVGAPLGHFQRHHIFEGGDGPVRIDVCRVNRSHYEYLEINEAELNAQLLSISQAASLGGGGRRAPSRALGARSTAGQPARLCSPSARLPHPVARFLTPPLSLAGPSTPPRGAADADAECPPTLPPPATVPPPIRTDCHFAPSPLHAPPADRRCAGDWRQVHVRRFHVLAELGRREVSEV
jgi:hypothetical protein